MVEVLVSTPDGVQVIDVCRPCQFLWFDDGEWGTLPPRAEEAPAVAPPPIRDHAAAVALARMELERARMRLVLEDHPVPDASWKWLPGILGLPVEMREHAAARRPWATWLLMGVMALVGLVAGFERSWGVAAWGFVPADAWRHGGLTLLTAFFLDTRWWFLLTNAYFLWVFGDNAEDVLGVPRYLLLLLLATLAGDAGYALVGRHPGASFVGASAGISGVIAYYTVRFPHQRLGTLILGVWWLRFPAAVGLALWAGIHLFYAGILSVGGATAAVLAGALVGVLFRVTLDRRPARRA